MKALKAFLIEKLNKELPGKKAHLQAAPYRRVDFFQKELLSARKSAVLILFYVKEGEPHIVLIQRPKYDGAHSGQVSFPGGKQEELDESNIHTALREANEEIGIMIADVDVIGQLTDVYIPVSQFNVVPVIGFVDCVPNFIIDKREVEELIELKISDLTNVQELATTKIRLANNTTLNAPCFKFNNKIIWGATALILNELRVLLQG